MPAAAQEAWADANDVRSGVLDRGSVIVQQGRISDQRHGQCGQQRTNAFESASAGQTSRLASGGAFGQQPGRIAPTPTCTRDAFVATSGGSTFQPVSARSRRATNIAFNGYFEPERLLRLLVVAAVPATTCARVQERTSARQGEWLKPQSTAYRKAAVPEPITARTRPARGARAPFLQG